MPSWNEHHYARAEEFLRTIADAVPAPMPGQAAPEVVPAAPAAAAAMPPTAAPTAASVFKKIPWKK